MTRLQSKEISDIAPQLSAYDQELLFKTGHNLRQIACHAAQLKEQDALGARSAIKVGVVPMQLGVATMGMAVVKQLIQIY